MVRSLTFYLNVCWSIGVLLCLSLCACSNSEEFYKKGFTVIQKKELANQFGNGLGYYYYQGDVGEQFLLKEALSLDPNNGSIYRAEGIPYLKRGFAASCYPLYKKAIAYDPLGWQGYRGYCYLYFYRDYERALADFNALDTLTPNVVDYPQSISVDYMRAICYLQLGDNDTALTFFKRHIKEELRLNEEKYVDLKSFLFQGIAYHRKGDYEAAATSYKRALKHAPENADLWYWLAKSSLEAGKVNAAAVAIEKASKAFEQRDFNKRNYVEEFFQTYQGDIDNLKTAILTYEGT